ncbi:MAG: metallophosphoesterase [Bacteroidales bacterium]
MKILIFLVSLIAICYVAIRIYYIVPLSSAFKLVAVLLTVGILVLMIVSFAVGLDKLPFMVATIVYEVTTSWFFILLYLLMIFLLMDILRICHLIPKDLLLNSWMGTLIVINVIFIIFLYGNINYHSKSRTVILIKTEKRLQKEYKIVMISDLHLGYHNQRKELAKWIDKINKEKADLILIGGDVIDISTHPINLQRSFEEFGRLNAPAYACLGNHEYISGRDKAEEFYRNAGIHLLIDSCTVFNNDILIVGRDDKSNEQRKTLTQLLQKYNGTKYSFLIDHQPYNLEQAEQNNIDFQFSGHTHYGQVFPINLITDAIFEKAYGRHQRGKTNYYIFSGLGIWGGKFRIATKSEYAVVILTNVK